MKLVLTAVFLLSSVTAAFTQTISDAALRKIEFDQKPGDSISLGTTFRDENGRSVPLGTYFGPRPVILVLGYYGCPMLCTVVLNGMIGGLQDLPLKMGKDYDVVNVSIDPHETSALAAEKKRSYLTRFGQAGVGGGWHFLTGDEANIRKLAGEVGFNYAYDSTIHQYAHPSGLVILTPQGKISHYLSGVVFSAADLKNDLSDAAAAKIGSPIEQFFLLCFHYSPTTGKYSATVLTVVRTLGVGTLAALIAFMAGAHWRKTRRV